MFRNPIVDVAVVLFIVLLFFGPKRLPGLGKSLGSGIREFKDSITGGDDETGHDSERSALPPTEGPAVTPPPAPTGTAGSTHADPGSTRARTEQS